MRAEKKYLVEEVSKHLNKSDYVILADYTKLTVPEAKELRAELEKHGAEFHVVKNSVLNVAAKAKGYPDMAEFLTGQVGIVVGGNDTAAIAKAVKTFAKAKEKLSFKVGVMALKKMSAAELNTLADLPSMDSLRAQLLSLLSTPASGFVRVLDAQAKKETKAA